MLNQDHALLAKTTLKSSLLYYLSFSPSFSVTVLY